MEQELFGFTYLMFLSGLELDFDIINGGSSDGEERRFFENPITLALLVFGLTIVIAFGTAEILLHFELIQEPFIIALILSTTSLGIVVPVLKERGLMTSVRPGPVDGSPDCRFWNAGADCH